MLYYDAPNPAPNPRRVRIAMSEKGITLPTQNVSIIGGEHKAPDFVAKYAPGQVPVLELDDGTMLGESVSICRYLEALHPQVPLFGVGAQEIAVVDMMIRRVEFTLMNPIGMVWAHTHPFTARVVIPQYTEFGESNRPRAINAMRALDALLSARAANGHDWLASDTYSMADIVLLTTIDFATFIGLAMPDDVPALSAWHARATARPSAAV